MSQHPNPQNNEQHNDPAGSTGMFHRFVVDNDEPEAAPRRPVTPILLGALGVVVAIAIIVVVIVTWS